jgi:hypothetical protein
MRDFFKFLAVMLVFLFLIFLVSTFTSGCHGNNHHSFTPVEDEGGEELECLGLLPFLIGDCFVIGSGLIVQVRDGEEVACVEIGDGKVSQVTDVTLEKILVTRCFPSEDEEQEITVCLICPLSLNDWIHEYRFGEWPVDNLILGNRTYYNDALLDILYSEYPNNLIKLARCLVVAKLNFALGVPTPQRILDAIEQADKIIGNRDILDYRENISYGTRRDLCEALGDYDLVCEED